MNCKNCNFENETIAHFCENCGADLSKAIPSEGFSTEWTSERIAYVNGLNKAVFWLGILSIPLDIFFGGGSILGIIAFLISKNGRAMYKENPSMYAGKNKFYVGFYASIVGVIVGVVSLIMCIQNYG